MAENGGVVSQALPTQRNLIAQFWPAFSLVRDALQSQLFSTVPHVPRKVGDFSPSDSEDAVVSPGVRLE